MSVSHAVALVLLGLVVGAYGTVVGSGGGFLLVPVLLLVYRVQPAEAAGTSLAVVFLNALSGSVSYARQRRIDYRPGLAFAAATLPGAILGAYLASLFGGRAFRVLFAVLLFAIAALLLWRPVAATSRPRAMPDGRRIPGTVERELTDRFGQVFRYRYNLVGGIAASIAIGFLSSILGIGGGIIHVPMLIYALGFPAHIATATSQFILAFSAGVGAATHVALGHVLIGPALALGAGVVVGAPLGAEISRRMHGNLVARVLSLALVVVAVRLLFA